VIPDFEEAEKAFDGLREMDPFRLDEIEIYSNMLYVMNKKAKLAQIAHEYAQIDKNRAEVCCLIGRRFPFRTVVLTELNSYHILGNYFSSRDEHMKAIQYFKRSLQLNRDYLPAWTLMGHEFVELKNSHAAIEAYRRAVGK
jgi:anaphase-promoting complex subunit 8